MTNDGATAGRRVRRAAVAVVVALALGGCAGAGDEDAGGSSTADEATGSAETGAGAQPGDAGSAADEGGEAASGDEADAASAGPESEESTETGAPADDGAGGGAVPVAPVGQPLQAGRAIVAVAEIDLEVDDVEDAARRATETAVGAGGFLAHQEAVTADRRARLTLRVPTERYDQVVADLAGLGEVLGQRVDTTDVTDQVVDLEARIASGRASVERVRALLAESGDVAQLALVEGELARREAELESLLGRQRVLADQVDLATVHVSVAEPEAVAELAADVDDDERAGFLGGLDRGLDAAAAVLGALFVVLGFALPLLPVAALALLARHLRRRRTSPTPVPAP